MNRRNFLFCLGAGIPVAITGFFVTDSILSVDAGDSTEISSPCSEFPELSSIIKKSYKEDQLILSGGTTTCVVNKTGERIIHLMDGKKNLPDICSAVSEHYSIENTDTLQASVATFICQLGEAGLLSSPFYVTMYETC